MPSPVANPPLSLSFGMIALAGGQTVRLNAVNIVRTQPTVFIAQFPCKVELDRFFIRQGEMIAQRVIDNLGYGKSAFVEAALSDAGSRIAVTGAIKVGSAQLSSARLSRRSRYMTQRRAARRA